MQKLRVPDYSDIANNLNGVFATLRLSTRRQFDLLFVDGALGGRRWRPSDDLSMALDMFLAGLDPQARVEAYRVALRARAREATGTTTLVWRDADGTRRWLALSLAPRAGDRAQWSVLLLDVSAQKEAEKLAADRAVEFETLFGNAPENIVRYDRDGRFVDFNRSLEVLLGVSAQSLRGKLPAEVFPNGEYKEILDAATRAMATGERQDVELSTQTLSGKTEYHLVSLVPERDSAGEIVGAIGFGRNIGDLQRVQNALADSENLLRGAMKVFPDMVWLKDRDGRYILCNDKFEAFNSVPAGALLGKTAKELYEGKSRPVHAETDEQALASRGVVEFSLTVSGPNYPQRRTYDVRKIAVRGCGGEVVGILGTARDVTEKQKLEEEIRIRERAYRSLAEHSPDCLVRYDIEGRRIYMNRAMQEMFLDCFVTDEHGVMTPAYPIPGVSEDYRPISELALDVLATGRPVTVERLLRGRAGHDLTHEIRLVPEFDVTGKIESVLGIGRDITEQKSAERQLKAKERELEALAYSDHLTGLANRAAFRAELSRRMRMLGETSGKLALLIIDIDRFKSINDTLGHMFGDELLVEFARRLRDTVDSAATVARLGGDEFVVILSYVAGRAGALAVADAIAKNIARPMTIGGGSIYLTVSIGIALGPDDSMQDDELFRYADIALYSAKMAGHGRACCFSDDLREKTVRRFELEAMMNDAVQQGEFVAHFQAKVDLATGRVNGAEALCRWRHQTLGAISPAEFIPVAEETGQIIEIGKIVLLDACRVAVACNAGRDEIMPIAVNLSARQLLFGGFLGAFGMCLETTGCKAEWIELEITESVLLSDDSAASRTLERLTALGARLTIDDFGTGYSSLSYLGRLPISTLKIDQSFVRGMMADRKQEVLVRAIIAMAQGLGLKTVAEGVETQEAAEKLRAFGCDVGQGYLWSRPAPAEDLLALLDALGPERLAQAE
jgi:diguanylate cyclase (GGDEF)-like protein/PAS domain S-box-containing protein